jgi:NAD+ synthase
MKDNIVNWIRGQFGESGASAVIGISGGKDSTVAAALCAEALGKERVVGVLMPQGEQSDIDVSYKVCEYLDIRGIEVNIGESTEILQSAIDVNDIVLSNAAVMNIPARIRMTVLYAVAASLENSGRVVNTCNASESYIGWETKFGDAAGDFSPLGNLTVSEVKAVGCELGLPAEFIEKIPMDGLCNKSDEEAIGFTYSELDRYILEGVCDNEQTKAIIDKMHTASGHKRAPMPVYMKEGSS